MVRGRGGVTRDFLGCAAAEPQQSEGKDGADLAEVGREVVARPIWQVHCDPSRIVLLILYRRDSLAFSTPPFMAPPVTSVLADGRPTAGFTLGQI